MKRYIAYVDGFNLYNRRLKHTKYKWLNLKKLIESYGFDSFNLTSVKYFTAKVENRRNDPGVKQRQDFYLRALKTEPLIQIYFGQFKMREVSGELLKEGMTIVSGNQIKSFDPTGKIVKIRKFEEKGSDVNIATHMLADGFRDKFDVAVLITNDVDLQAPISIINDELKKPLILISPDTFHVPALRKHASVTRFIEDSQLATAQFQPQLTDYKGRFSKPHNW